MGRALLGNPTDTKDRMCPPSPAVEHPAIHFAVQFGQVEEMCLLWSVPISSEALRLEAEAAGRIMEALPQLSPSDV